MQEGCLQMAEISSSPADTPLPPCLGRGKGGGGGQDTSVSSLQHGEESWVLPLHRIPRYWYAERMPYNVTPTGLLSRSE